MHNLSLTPSPQDHQELRAPCSAQVQGWEDSNIFKGFAVFWVVLVLAYVLAASYLALAILFIIYRSRTAPPKPAEGPDASKNSVSSQAGADEPVKAPTTGGLFLSMECQCPGSIVPLYPRFVTSSTIYWSHLHKTAAVCQQTHLHAGCWSPSPWTAEAFMTT